jgi:hypothetical protein
MLDKKVLIRSIIYFLIIMNAFGAFVIAKDNYSIFYNTLEAILTFVLVFTTSSFVGLFLLVPAILAIKFIYWVFEA